MEIAEGGKLCAEAETSDGLPSAVTNLEMAICGGRNETRDSTTIDGLTGKRPRHTLFSRLGGRGYRASRDGIGANVAGVASGGRRGQVLD